MEEQIQKLEAFDARSTVPRGIDYRAIRQYKLDLLSYKPDIGSA